MLQVRFNGDITGSDNKGRRKVRELLFIVIRGTSFLILLPTYTMNA